MMESDRVSKDEILLVQMKEVWSDIRSYRSNVWQIVGFTLVALSLFFGQVVTASFSDEFLRWSFLSILLMAFQAVIWEISQEAKQRLLTLRDMEEARKTDGASIDRESDFSGKEDTTSTETTES